MMMKWKIKWLPEAVKDLENIDNSVRVKVLKAIKKLEKEPIKYGEPLGHKIGLDLTNLYKINVADGYRVVYYADEKEIVVAVISVGKRAGHAVYKTTSQRIAEYRAATQEELDRLSSILKRI